jgi:hypothetical protein
MTTYARVVGNQAVDVTTTDPHTLFTPTVAQQFITVPDSVVNGSIQISPGSWAPPPPPPPAAPVPFPLITPARFYNCFTLQEMLYIKASSDPKVKEFFARYQVAYGADEMIDPNLNSVQGGLNYLSITPVVPTPSDGPTPYIQPSRIMDILNGKTQ